MRLITLFAASLAIGSATAAPSKPSIQPFVESGGKFELNSAMYTTENFTATDGETYEIVKRTPNQTHYTYQVAQHYSSTDNPWQTYLTGIPEVEGRSIRPAFNRRQQSSDDPKNRWRANSNFRDSCPFGSISGDTGPNAPTTGRCMAIRDWCANNPGNWDVFPQDYFSTNGGYYPLVSSGAAGTTACHFGVIADGALTAVGSNDVRDWTRESLNRYTRSFNGVFRVRSYGNIAGSGVCNGVRPRGLRWKLDTLQGIQTGR